MCLAVARPADRDVDVLECTERLVDRGDIGGEIVDRGWSALDQGAAG